MNKTKLARISTLVLALFLTSVAAFAQRPCGCDYCQVSPERQCRNGNVVTTCADFLAVALCQAGTTATSANTANAANTAETTFLATFSEPTQAPAACVAN